MKLPWHNKTGYSKAIAILATILTISIGLCGVNFFATITFVPMAGPAPPPGARTWPGTLLSITGTIEIFGILGSILGFVFLWSFARRDEKADVEGEPNRKGTD